MPDDQLHAISHGADRPAAGRLAHDVARKTSANRSYQSWLTAQCEAMSGARGGLLMMKDSRSANFGLAALWPRGFGGQSDLAQALERALMLREDVVIEHEALQNSGGRANDQTIIVAHPIGGAGHDLPVGAVAVALDANGKTPIDPVAIARQLYWSAGWIEALAWRDLSESRELDVQRLRGGFDLMVVAGENARLQASALAVANELTARLQCSRVSIGIAHHNQVALMSISHAASVDRRSQLAGAIENAMDEALYQNASIAQPPCAMNDNLIRIAHRELAKASGAPVVASCVIPARGRSVGVITFERQAGSPFSEQDLKLVETAATLFGPVIDLQIRADRWISGRAVDFAGRIARKFSDPKSPALRLLSATAALLFLLTFFVKADFRVAAKSLIEGQIQRAIVAPYDGYVLRAPARAGDTVHRGDILAQLDDQDVRLEQTRWQYERQTLLEKHRDALANHDRAALTILGAQIEQAQAQLRLAEDQLARARIAAPFDGIVVAGDLSQSIGSPVERGRMLFELAPLDKYRVIIEVDERDIRFVRLGQPGRLVLAGMPGEPLALKVTKTTPIATSQDGRNFFRVEAALDKAAASLRPGMEGVSKITVSKKPLIWIWTHSLSEWIQVTIWQLLP
jgi:RND family efflux transporter MFP subunit